MFQSLLRTRPRRFFRSRSNSRDTDADQARLTAVAEAIDHALAAAEGERGGLNRRMDDVLARAALILGTGTDEYLDRDPVDNDFQNQFDLQIKNGHRRLTQLDTQIGHLRFLKTAAITRFPELNMSTRDKPRTSGA